MGKEEGVDMTGGGSEYPHNTFLKILKELIKKEGKERGKQRETVWEDGGGSKKD